MRLQGDMVVAPSAQQSAALLNASSLPPSEGQTGTFAPEKQYFYFNFNVFLKLHFPPGVRGSRAPAWTRRTRGAHPHSPTTRAVHSTGTAPTVRVRHSIWPIAFALYGNETISSSPGSALRCSFNLCIENTSDMKQPRFGCSGKEQTAFEGYLHLKCS